MKKYFLPIILCVFLLLSTSPVSAKSETPPPANVPDYVNIAWDAGNAETECEQLSSLTGVTYSSAYKFDPPTGSATFDGNTITLLNNTGLVFDFTALPDGVAGVIVKFATVANIWTYSPQATSDTGLHAFEYNEPGDPENSHGKYKELGHITFCWDADERDKAKASVVLGACSWTLGDGSLTPVTITLTNARLTLNGKVYEPKIKNDAVTYKETYNIKLPPGTYPYTWEALDPALFVGSGEGTLKVDSCVPKEEEKKEDKLPDVASGGSIPSLLLTVSPFLSGTLGMSLSYTLLKHKFFKRH